VVAPLTPLPTAAFDAATAAAAAAVAAAAAAAADGIMTGCTQT